MAFRSLRCGRPQKPVWQGEGAPSQVYIGVFRRLPSLDPMGCCGRLVGAGAPVAR